MKLQNNIKDYKFKKYGKNMENNKIIQEIYLTLEKLKIKNNRNLISEAYILYNQISHVKLSPAQRNEISDLGKRIDKANMGFNY
jgi:hypothetical protein